MDLILEQITTLLENNIFLTPEIRSELWGKSNRASSQKRSEIIENLKSIDQLQHTLIRKILDNNPHFFKDIKREIRKKHVHAHLKQERHEHIEELKKVEDLLEKTLSEI